MTARFFYTFAVQMQAILLGWRMYSLTQNPLDLGLIGLVEAAPALSLAMIAGYLVDRHRPLNIYRLVLFFSLASGLVMLVTQLPGWSIPISWQVGLLFTSSFLTGMARAFSQPAMFAIVPRIVPRDLLPKATAWMSSAMQTAQILGPALGGFTYGYLGMSASAGLVCAFLLVGIVSLSLVKHSPEALPAAQAAKHSRIHELLSGVKFVFRHPILLPALSLDMISVLFGGVTALLPIYAAQILFIGPMGLGALRASPAIGAALTSFWLASRDIREKAGRWLFSAVAGFGVCILVFAVSRDFWLSLLALTLSGAFDAVSMIVRSSAVQLVSPDHMRGKISAVNSIFIGSSNEIGEFESGVAARFLGTVPAAIFGGLICLGTVGVVAALSPALRSMNLKTLKAEIHN